jgi:hypothetical protein
MTIGLCRSMLGMLFLVLFLVGEARAETFEFLTYTPPNGWTHQTLQDGLAYRRPSGIGLITLYPSYAASGSAADEFLRMWRQRVEPAVPGPAPQPQLQRGGDYSLAVGQRQAVAQGSATTIMFVAIVGRGRALGLLAMASGDEAVREIAAFFDSIAISNGASGVPSPGASAPPAGEIEVDFDVPPGYVSRREGRAIVLTPTTIDDKTPCAYGVSPARASSGTLEADARAAVLEVLPGWQLKNDSYNAMRGTAGVGWPYYWFRTDVQRLVGGSYEYAYVMTMAYPAAAGRVNIVYGAGNPARCTLDDLAFARLFHSLRPRGWPSDGGKALARDLQGTWRNSQRLGMAQYKFLPGGRYEFGIGTVTTMGLFERTSSSVSDGRYELRGSELIVTPDRRDRGVAKYRVRIYDEFVQGRWTRAMSLLDESANPALEVQYMRVVE